MSGLILKDAILIGVIMIIAVIFIVFGLRFLKESQYLSRVGTKTTGHILSYDRQTRASSGGVSATWNKRVEFTTEAGQKIVFQGKVGALPKKVTPDSTIPVIYDPANPKNASIDTFWERNGVWVVFLTVGIAWTLIVVGMLAFILITNKPIPWK